MGPKVPLNGVDGQELSPLQPSDLGGSGMTIVLGLVSLFSGDALPDPDFLCFRSAYGSLWCFFWARMIKP